MAAIADPFLARTDALLASDARESDRSVLSGYRSSGALARLARARAPMPSLSIVSRQHIDTAARRHPENLRRLASYLGFDFGPAASMSLVADLVAIIVLGGRC